ncbi:hypothetical protein L484_009834 [Morus notabilis]|uniref:Uncharacterized protein n=1 Tax=Morus notabilis TaxID=981085 RepID=W9STE4_9ROSA|nr:hypothetical protein L484_009834 [Morus notabilis]
MAEKSSRLMNLIKHVKKIKKLFRKSEGKNSDHGEKLVPPHSTICCDELFFESDKKASKYGEKSSDDSFMAAFLAAQKHFALRSNIYI